MDKLGKTYTLKNGYSISKCECYDGYEMRTFWVIFNPSGDVYMKCGSYDEAHDLASHLVEE